MYPERFTQRYCDFLPRFHDIPADSRQLSWVLQQFDICFEANSSRFSSLVQALGHHLREQSQWILHLPAILNAFRRFTHRFRHILKRFQDIPADSRQISGILRQFDHRFEANSSRFSPLVQALLQHFWVQFQCVWHRQAILNAFQTVYPAFSPHFETLSRHSG